MEINQDKPLVSVIITTYNRPLNVLKRALASVLNQTYQNIEIILVNACPKNEKLEAEIREYIKNIKKVKYICLEENSLANKARNTGIKQSKGKYIAFLDDDDEWIIDKIELQVEKFVKGNLKNLGIVYSSFYEIEKDKKKKVINLSKKEGNILKDILKNNIIGGTSIPMLLKEALEKIGGFDEKFPSAQDFDVWIGICKEYNVGYIDKPLVNYYVTDDAITRNMDKRIKGWKMIEQKYMNLYSSYKNSYNYFLNMVAVQLLLNGYKKDGIEYYKKALKIRLFTFKNLKTIRHILKSIINK